MPNRQLVYLRAAAIRTPVHDIIDSLHAELDRLRHRPCRPIRSARPTTVCSRGEVRVEARSEGLPKLPRPSGDILGQPDEGGGHRPCDRPGTEDLASHGPAPHLLRIIELCRVRPPPATARPDLIRGT